MTRSERVRRAIVAGVLLLSGGAVADGRVAEAFISAFYSYDRAVLESMFSPQADKTAVLYYQQWAEAAHYNVDVRRPCRLEGGEWVCAITVNDDFGSALGYQATDTFRLTIDGDRVSAATFAGDDPPIFEELFGWIATRKREVLSGPCRDMFAGGETPGDCARAVATAARDFAREKGLPTVR